MAIANLRPVLVLLTAVALGGCAMNKLENSDCTWPRHAEGPLDLSREKDRAHLLDDIRVAEELAIRYGDVRWGPGPVRRERRDRECLQPLFGTIAEGHQITIEDISFTRAQLGDRGLNLSTNIPMAIAYLLFAAILLRGISARFSPADEVVPFTVAALVGSILLAVVTVGLGSIWEGLLEAVRVGNGHLSYRGLRLQWTQHRGELLILAVVAFWILALGYAASARRARQHTVA